MKCTMKRHLFSLTAATSLSCLLVASAQAIDFNWNVAGPADWSEGTNWDPAGPPTGGGGNHAFVNNGGTAEITSDIGDIQDIFVGVGADTTGTLNQSAGATFQGTGSWMFVGQDGGTGTYNLSGGTANKGRLYVGRNAGGNGTLNVSGTGVVDGEYLIAGVGGAVATVGVTETGSVQTSNNVEFHNAAVTISDDAVVDSGNEVWVGNGGGSTGTLNMDSGKIEAETWFAIGRDSSVGTVNLSGDAELRKVATDDGDDGNVSNSEGSFIIVGGLGTGGVGTLNIAGNATVWSDTGLAANETEGQDAFIHQSGGKVTVHDYAPRGDQPQFGSSIELDPNGWGEAEYHLSGGELDAETIEVGGALFDMTGGVLSATNFMGDLTQNGGTTSPGDSPGTMLISGNYSLASGDLLMEIEGVNAGTEYDQLIVTGDVSLAGDLTLAGLYAASPGDAFTLIDNQGMNAISGGFTGISEGSIVSLNGVDLTATYLGGDGNDFVLYAAVPEPATASLLGAMGLLSVARRRRRK